MTMPANTAPILLFTYNRPGHTRRTLEALCANELAEKSSLIVYCDGPKPGSSPEQLQRINEVRKIVRETPWPGKLELVEREANLGLAESVIRGVTATTSAFGSAIVLEDDIICSPAFLDYMNFALGQFRKEDTVGSINSWMFNVNPRLLPKYFFLHGGDCWGWATWERAWKYFEPDSQKLLDLLGRDKGAGKIFNKRWHDLLEAQAAGQVSSWHIRWHASLIINRKLGLFPARSYISNIGNDESGTHRADTITGTYLYGLNTSVDKEFLRKMHPANSRYVRTIMEFNRSYGLLRNRMADHVAYRYPQLYAKLKGKQP